LLITALEEPQTLLPMSLLFLNRTSFGLIHELVSAGARSDCDGNRYRVWRRAGTGPVPK